jgi:hypothetical protein
MHHSPLFCQILHTIPKHCWGIVKCQPPSAPPLYSNWRVALDLARSATPAKLRPVGSGRRLISGSGDKVSHSSREVASRPARPKILSSSDIWVVLRFRLTPPLATFSSSIPESLQPLSRSKPSPCCSVARTTIEADPAASGVAASNPRAGLNGFVVLATKALFRRRDFKAFKAAALSIAGPPALPQYGALVFLA